MRIVLIGGNGFIGHNLAQKLSSIHEVIIVGRRNEGEVNLPKHCKYIQADYTDPVFIQNTFKKGDYVVHLAYNSTPKTSFDNPVKDLSENVTGAVNLFSGLKGIEISKLLYVSSGGTVYGKTTDQLISETHLTNPISPYGITKLTIEKYALFYNQVENIPIVIARPSNPFGPYQRFNTGQGFVAAAINAALNNSSINVFGQYGTIRDYIYIDDLVNALKVLLFSKQDNAEIYNIGSGVGINNLDIVNGINAYVHKLGFSCKTNILPERIFDVPYNVLCANKLKQIGWSVQHTFHDSLNRTIDWYLNNKND